jgi:hypothetical protein
VARSASRRELYRKGEFQRLTSKIVMGDAAELRNWLVDYLVTTAALADRLTLNQLGVGCGRGGAGGRVI